VPGAADPKLNSAGRNQHQTSGKINTPGRFKFPQKIKTKSQKKHKKLKIDFGKIIYY
jgi:hypothetical protein